MKSHNPFNLQSVIIGTGSYIPTRIVANTEFLSREFYDADGKRIEKPNQDIIATFESITGIQERRHVTDDLTASDIAFFAAHDALKSSHVDKETLDYLIVAHNFGDIQAHSTRSAYVPSIAARVKYKLGIHNPKTIAHDIPFGCPGWLQGVIQADCYIKTGAASRVLVIGAETLSRIADPHDMDSMIYADGAGAAIFQAVESRDSIGIISHAARTDTIKHAYLLRMGKSYNPAYGRDDLFLKMDGHKLYEYALRTVPGIVKESLDKAGMSIGDVSKVLIHQANAKMDDAILKRLYALYGIKTIPQDVMPMTIGWLGNSSVATLPTMLDLLHMGRLDSHRVHKGDTLVFASVGAGMSINSVVYTVSTDSKK